MTIPLRQQALLLIYQANYIIIFTPCTYPIYRMVNFRELKQALLD